MSAIDRSFSAATHAVNSFSQAKSGINLSSELEKRALNPQPLPPKESFLSSILNLVALNPQPLPPRAKTSFDEGDFCGNIPRPVPPRPLDEERIWLR